MHGQGEFSIIKGSICNILIEAANIYNILQRPADSKGLIVELKRDFKDRDYDYFEPVHPNIIYRTLNYSKHARKSMMIFPFQKVSQAKK